MCHFLDSMIIGWHSFEAFLDIEDFLWVSEDWQKAECAECNGVKTIIF